MIEWVFDNASLIGLLFFFCFFVVTALWIYRPGARDSYQKHAGIPFTQDEHHGS